MANILVAGANGALGALVVRALMARGHGVVALVRAGASTQRLPPEVTTRVGDALRPATLAGAFDGIDVLVSCLGASTVPDPRAGVRGYDRVDVPAHLHLLAAAKAASVRRVVYVSVAGAQDHRDLVYFDAHERVVDAIRASGLEACIVRPTGFFSAVEQYLDLARNGVIPLFGDGTARSNPIADEDLAEEVAAMVEGEPRERTVGGPEVLPRRAFGELAFAALGKPPRLLRVPAGLVYAMATLVAWFLPRVGQALAFIVRVSTTDCIAEPVGTRRLADHFAACAVRARTR